MPNLDKLTIKGFKSIREMIDFELKNLNIIVGANGAGKSNLIEFFRMISAMMKTNGLKEFIAGNADAYLFDGPKATPKIKVKMASGLTVYEFELVPTEDGSFFVTEGKAFNPALCAWQVYHVHDTGPYAGMRRFNDAAHNEALFSDASNIAPFLAMLKRKHEADYQRILDAVRLIIPFFDDFILEPNDNEQIRLNWRQQGLKDYPMRPSQLSDGSIRFICLATALLQPVPPPMIIIDEPELGLHPAAISLLAELIRLAAERTQVVIATQSPALIDQFGIEDIIVASRKDGASTFERLNEKDFSVWLEDYSLGELLAKNVIAGGPVYE